jgi:putative Ca2+/H+ antiporter (TMEM165/GDT1 family)
MNIAHILIVFGVVFIGELPDKSLFASLVLGTRYRRSYVWVGAAAAFLVHVVIAVMAGHFLTLLPQRIVDFVVSGLFLLGAGLLFFGRHGANDEPDLPEKRAAHSFIKVFSTSFVVVFLGEWGDITQIATANYAAKYHDPLGVGIGAVLALWSVAGLGVLVGAKLLNRVPGKLLQRITGCILLLFGILSLIAAVR